MRGGEKLNWKNWLIKKLGGSTAVSVKDLAGDQEVEQALMDTYLRELAFWTCVNKISNALTKCEFRTYAGGKEVRGPEYYRWNLEPNRNQNAATFRTKLIGKLYRDNEALVISVNNELFVADSYIKTSYALKDYEFTQVTVDDYTFSDTFWQRDVLFFELNSKDMRKLMNGLYESYRNLIGYAIKAYRKSRGSRGILNISALAQADQLFEEKLDKLMSKHFKKFFESENGVLPLFEGFSYDDLTSNKTYSSESTRDIKALADDIFDFTARATAVPPSLAKGDVQDTSKAVDELLTFGLDPLVQILQQEINRKSNGIQGLSKGNCLKIDTRAVKHIDIFDIATPMEKLISSGVFTINDILRTIGEPEIQEEWANQHFITKNYATIQDLLEGLSIEGR